MPTPLGYLTENGLSSYPFKDSCSLIPFGTSSPLANDVFLDFQLTTTNTLLRRAALSNISTHDGQSGEKSIILTFAFFLYNPATSKWSTVTNVVTHLVSLVADKALISSSQGAYRIKVVCGRGMVSLAAGYPNLRFKTDVVNNNVTAEFSTSTIIPVPPRVTFVRFKNVNEASPVLSVAGSQPIYLQAGANINFTSNTDNTGLVVLKGTGTGLYDPCLDLPSDVIKSINGTGGDQNDNFTFVSGDCYRTIYHPGITAEGLPIVNDPPALEFKHVCRPKCSQDEVNAFAYYENRVQDAVNQIGDFVTGVAAGLKTQIDAITARRQADVISPYLEVQDAVTLLNNRNYEAIAIGLYDPNKKKMVCDVSASFTSGIASKAFFDANPIWGGWVLRDNTAILKEENNAYGLNSFAAEDHSKITLFTQRGIDCRGSVVGSFVVHAPAALQDEALQVSMQVYENSVVTSTAYKYHVLAPSPGPYFNVKSRRGLTSNGSHAYTISIELFDTDPVWTGNTAFYANINSGHIFSNASYKINNAPSVSVHPGQSGGLIFSNRVVTYPERVVITFDLLLAAGTPVSMTLNMVVGLATNQKTLSFS